MVRPSIAALALTAVFALAAAPCAEAHAALSRASPRVGSTIGASPKEVRMWFSEALEPAFSNASVVGAEQGAKAVVDPSDHHELVIPLARPLAPGRYQVKWAVVSVDGHRTEGDFHFTVGRGR